MEEVDKIRDLNKRFDNLRHLIFQPGQQEGDNLIKEADDNVIENGGNKLSYDQVASEILSVLDDFLPTCKGNLFNKYAFVYYHLLNLCEHDTHKICNLLDQNNFLDRNKYVCDMLKQKIESLKDKDTIKDKSGELINSNSDKKPRFNEDELIGEYKE